MDWGSMPAWIADAVSVAALVVALNGRRSDKAEAAEKRLDLHEGRLQKIEADMVHLPGKDSVHGLEMAMQEMKGQMAVIIERVGPIKAIAERMQEVLLEGAKR